MLFRSDYWALLKECRKDHAAITYCSNDCLDTPVDEHLEALEQEASDVLESLRKKPRPLAEERAQLEAVAAAINEAVVEARRSGKPSVVVRLERQMRLRGVSAPTSSSPKTTKE